MLMMNSVLNNVAPYLWEQGVIYDNRRFALFELNVGDQEYTTEINAFVNENQRINVTSLRRVQNPFQLGSFILRKQQKEFRNEGVEVGKWYHPVDRNDLDIALEFNLDVRRYTHKYAGQQDISRKNAKFYKTPTEAYNAINASEKIIIICNVLGDSNAYGPVTKENTAEYMPIYIADV